MRPSPARADDGAAQACLASYEQAQRFRTAGALFDAREQLRACARTECPELIRRDCLPWLREIETAIPTVIVSARRDDGTDVPAARVFVDGTLFQERPTGAPLEVAPGKHVFRVEAAQGLAQEQTVIVNVGEKNRIVRLKFPAASRLPVGSTERAVSPATSTPVFPFVLGAVGLALGATGITLDVVENSALSNLRDECATRVCAASETDPIRTKMIVGDVLIAAGVVCVGVATWLFLRPTAKTPPAAAKTHALRDIR